MEYLGIDFFSAGVSAALVGENERRILVSGSWNGPDLPYVFAVSQFGGKQEFGPHALRQLVAKPKFALGGFLNGSPDDSYEELASKKFTHGDLVRQTFTSLLELLNVKPSKIKRLVISVDDGCSPEHRSLIEKAAIKRGFKSVSIYSRSLFLAGALGDGDWEMATSPELSLDGVFLTSIKREGQVLSIHKTDKLSVFSLLQAMKDATKEGLSQLRTNHNIDLRRVDEEMQETVSQKICQALMGGHRSLDLPELSHADSAVGLDLSVLWGTIADSSHLASDVSSHLENASEDNPMFLDSESSLFLFQALGKGDYENVNLAQREDAALFAAEVARHSSDEVVGLRSEVDLSLFKKPEPTPSSSRSQEPKASAAPAQRGSGSGGIHVDEEWAFFQDISPTACVFQGASILLKDEVFTVGGGKGDGEATGLWIGSRFIDYEGPLIELRRDQGRLFAEPKTKKYRFLKNRSRFDVKTELFCGDIVELEKSGIAILMTGECPV